MNPRRSETVSGPGAVMHESVGITFACESEEYPGARVERPAPGTEGVPGGVVNIANEKFRCDVDLGESETRQGEPEALLSHVSLRS